MKMITNYFKNLQVNNLRNIVQIIFSLYLLYIGWEFYQFVEYLKTPGVNLNNVPTRSPAVEGFLPIYALMSLKGWLSTGVFDQLRPAALVIFLAIIFTALIARKGFCSWLCPVGTISELSGKVGRSLTKRNFSLPKYLHYPLMLVKYAIVLFFLYSIMGMPGEMIPLITQGDYYKIADVKMLYFFLDLSKTAVLVILGLVVISLFIRNFWCKYLCPYGALLGIFSFFSPLGIKRNQDLCIQCKKCNQACPNDINVMKNKGVDSPECMACLNCISACPKKGALSLKIVGKVHFDEWYLVLVVLGVFFGIILLAQITGHWNTGISIEDFSRLIPYARDLSH